MYYVFLCYIQQNLHIVYRCTSIHLLWVEASTFYMLPAEIQKDCSRPLFSFSFWCVWCMRVFLLVSTGTRMARYMRGSEKSISSDLLVRGLFLVCPCLHHATGWSSRNSPAATADHRVGVPRCSTVPSFTQLLQGQVRLSHLPSTGFSHWAFSGTLVMTPYFAFCRRSSFVLFYGHSCFLPPYVGGWLHVFFRQGEKRKSISPSPQLEEKEMVLVYFWKRKKKKFCRVDQPVFTKKSVMEKCSFGFRFIKWLLKWTGASIGL